MVTALENIPVFSWVFLRGKCRHCKQPISVRYPLMELLTGILFAVATLKFDLSLELVVYCGFLWALIVLTTIDLEHKLLPNRIVIPLFVSGWIGLIVAALVNDDVDRLRDAGVGALIFGGFLFLVAFIYPAGMGGGDVKLAFVLGTFLGYAGGIEATVVGMFLAFFLGGVIGIAVMVAKGGSRKSMIPFGPFLAVGTAIAIFVGNDIADAYLGSF
jgi:leader peptidase (prepilin peptidase) / N-methyltransferase